MTLLCSITQSAQITSIGNVMRGRVELAWLTSHPTNDLLISEFNILLVILQFSNNWDAQV